VAINRDADRSFENLARALSDMPSPRKTKIADSIDEGFDSLDMDPYFARKDDDEYEDNRRYVMDYSRPGAGLTEGSAESFFLPLADLGDGAVDTRLQIGSGSATFTRSTVATCRLSSGLLKKVASGVARSHYLEDGTYGGYLAEGARTNRLLRSEEFDNASWFKTDTTITADAAAAPDGTTTADLMTEGAAGTAIVSQSVTATADVNHAVSRFFKFGNTQWVRMQIASGANSVNAWFDIQNGVVGSNSGVGTGVFASAKIESWGNGWYRCSVVGNLGGGLTGIASLSISADSDGSATRVAGATRYEWGAQFENNVSFASSYIPTTTASVTRNADELKYPGVGNVNQVEGSLYAEYLVTSTPSLTQSVVTLAGASNEWIGLSTFSNSSQLGVVDGGNTQAAMGDVISAGTIIKQAACYAVNDFASSTNGAALDTDQFGTLPETTHIGIGYLATGGNTLFGAVKNVRIWKRRLSNARLQALTA
jgi:hypothetical protein